MSKTILLNHSNWHFTKENTGIPTAIMGEAITLPHTWNAVDGQDGGNDYYRGTCWYTLALTKPAIPAGGKAVLQLDGAAMTAAVYLNGEKLAEHKGGYSTFRVDLTDHLKDENLLAISVDNCDNDTVYPQKADFTFYGGIYRDVTLHIVPAEHFALPANGAPALKVTPIVTDLAAKTVEVTLEAAAIGAQSVSFALEGQSITAPVENGTAKVVFTLNNAHLWDGVDDPFLYTVALAENAAANGVSFFFRAPVTQLRAIPGGWQVTAGGKRFTTRYLVNSAGLFSAQVAKLAGVGDYRIYPCRGEYFILDQIARDVLPLPVYPAPKQGAGGLGVHLTPTVHGNLLIGPSAEYIESPADTASTQPVLDELFRQAQRLLPGLERRQIIGAYAGIRPKQAPPGEGGYWDFVLREDRPGLIDLVGIESPGLTASAPLAEEVVALIGQGMDLTPDPTYDGHREGIPRFRDLPPDERAKLIEQDPDFCEAI